MRVHPEASARCPVRGKGLAPVYDRDFYADDFIRDPYPHYAAMRALGPVVWLPRHGNFAITRYREVRDVLRNWQVFSSAHGVAADAVGCAFGKGNTLASDPPEHDQMRMASGAPLLPGALESIRDRIENAAIGLVDDLAIRRNFDGIADVARFLPLTVVRELVGLPEDGRENMLKWAAAAFDFFGVQNQRGRDGFETLKDMRNWIIARATPEFVKPGSWTARLHELADRGDIPRELFPVLIRDYLGPSLDTTISATGHLLYQLGKNPDQWQILRRNPALIANAVNEAVRVGSPIRSFARTVTRDIELAGVSLPAGARVMVLYASANRDEQKFPDPDRFDVTRRGLDHVGFGHGIHMCVGMHLARLEMESLLKALVDRIETIEVGEPTVALNNTIYAFASLPVTVGPGKNISIAQKTGRVPSPSNSPDWLATTIAHRKTLARNVISLELVAASGHRLPSFEAGAHIDVEIAPGVVRQYSLCGAPFKQNCYRLGILLTENSRGGSSAIHDGFLPGSSIRIRGPRNSFTLDRSAERSLLLAGGIGITPLLGMAYDLDALGADFNLHYWARSREHAAFVDELAQSAFNEKLHFHFSDDPQGRFDVGRAFEPPSPNTHVYICGPAAFNDAALSAASRLKWAQPNVHTERFGGDIPRDGQPFTVVAERRGIAFEVPAGTTILEALVKNGIDAEASCQSGVCGTCLTTVLEGIPDHRDMVQTADEKACNNKIAICCSRSRSRRLVLDL
jgi:cytochrome P450/ferredoxin-NADP reductase